jgi:hypothetical protein
MKLVISLKDAEEVPLFLAAPHAPDREVDRAGRFRRCAAATDKRQGSDYA